MEANKPEAERCLEIAQKYLRAKDLDKAAKFLSKSMKLYPLPAARQLQEAVLADLKAKRSSSAGSASSEQSTGASSSFSSSSRAPPEPERMTSAENGRTYTEKQAQIVRDVLAEKGKENQHFRVLGVSASATADEIKRAYKKRALKLHPDKNPAPGADEAFKLISQAYSVLSDEEKKAAYERWGDDGEGTSSGPPGRPGHGTATYTHDDAEEIFRMFFGGGAPGGFGGPGFRVYTNGREHPIFRSRRRQRNDDGQDDGRGRNNALFMQLLQLLPILVLMLMSFSGGGHESARIYSLNQTSQYPHRRETGMASANVVKGIPYYVQPTFNRQYAKDYRSLRRVEEAVVQEYRKQLHAQCYQERELLRQLKRQAKRGTEKQKQHAEERARLLPMESCRQLNEKFPDEYL